MAKYIDADKLTETIKYYYEHTGVQSTNAEHYAYGVVLKEIDKTPSADVVEERHGEWVRQNGGFFFLCSECGKAAATKGNFCHSCGARM